MVNTDTQPEYEVTSKWYSFSAKHQFILANKTFKHFNYPLATRFAQESIEFAGKAILKLNNKDCDKSHDFSEVFKHLKFTYPRYKRTIRLICQFSKKWLNKDVMEESQYGCLGESPEKLYSRKDAQDAIKDAKKTLNFLIKVERMNKTEIILGILNGRVYGNRADRFPLNRSQCNRIDRDIWKTRLKSNLHSTSLNIKIKDLPLSKIDSSTDIVINPFGEIFPSNDNPVDILEKILNFVSTGGTFINLGGLPFWASRNVLTNEGRSHVVRQITVQNNQILLSTPLANTLSWQMFGIITTGDTHTISGPNSSSYFQEPGDKRKFGDLERNIRINEYRGLKEEVTNIIPIIRMNRRDYGEIYPISLKKIELGYLFLASLDIQTDDEVQLIIDSIKGYLNWLF